MIQHKPFSQGTQRTKSTNTVLQNWCEVFLLKCCVVFWFSPNMVMVITAKQLPSGLICPCRTLLQKSSEGFSDAVLRTLIFFQSILPNKLYTFLLIVL